MRGRLLAAVLAAVAMLAPLTAAGCGGGGAPRYPILFVHGFGENDLLWSTMVSRLRRDGWTVAQIHNWNYNPYPANAVTARELKAKVDGILAQTGAKKVDLITHGMGSLSARYYLKNLGGTAKVGAFVSLGGPNHGSTQEETCLIASCIDMHRGSSFLNQVNAGDETPGPVRYLTWRSSCDEYVTPRDSVELAGATNLDAGCVTHVGLTTDARVYASVREFVR